VQARLQRLPRLICKTVICFLVNGELSLLLNGVTAVLIIC
jgi:hypothetical protein